MVTLMKPLCGHANGAGLNSTGRDVTVAPFRKLDPCNDLREAEPHESDQKSASPYSFDDC